VTTLGSDIWATIYQDPTLKTRTQRSYTKKVKYVSVTKADKPPNYACLGK